MGSVVLFLGIGTAVISGIYVRSWLALILLIEFTMFLFLFRIYGYNLAGYSAPAIKYFFSQRVGSIFLILGAWGYHFIIDYRIFFRHLFILRGLFLKLGVFPFHFWVIPVAEELPFLQVGVFLVPLKILPLTLLTGYINLLQVPIYFYRVVRFRVFSILWGIFLGINRNNIRYALGASSITHRGWFLFATLGYNIVAYFLFYSVALLLILYALNYSLYFSCSLALLILAGLPPFRVFFGKLVVLSRLVNLHIPLIFLIPALITSAFRLFYYLKFSFHFFLLRRFFYGRAGLRFLI